MRVIGVLIAAIGTLALAACEPETPIEQVGLDIDLAPCLGAIDSAGIGDRDGGAQPVVSTCRDNLDVTVAAATVNTCLVMQELGAGSPAQRLPLQWTGGQLLEPFPDRLVDLPPGRRLTASLFFLAVGDETGAVCDALEVATTCDGDDCVLKLHQAEVTPLADGSTVFDFTATVDGELRCVAETGGAFGSAAVETCDGMDNDCDRIIDEAIPGTGEPCEDGIGACNARGETFCDPGAGMVVCSATAGQPGSEAAPADEGDACATDDATCCDGVDDDCDGVADEHIACSPCGTDDDCAENIVGGQCVMGLCKSCDPADHAGCAGTELCCRAGGEPTCEPVSFGPAAAEQCTACDTPCVVVRERDEGPDQRIQSADSCGDRQCVCGFGPACSEPAPFCVGGQCLECLGNGDCGPQELCCDGQCQPTGAEQCAECGLPCNDEIANRCIDRECRCGEGEQCAGARAACIPAAACDGDPGNPDCSPRSFECEECLEDVDCVDEPEERACVERQCRECKDDVDIFCTNNPNLADRPECVESDCFECDRRNHDGCAEDGDEPFCDADDNACRACADDAECRLRPGDRDQCVEGRCVVCDPVTYEGCVDPSQPVCDPQSLTCRGCGVTPECDPLSGGGAFPKQCVDGRCEGCDPDDNRGCNPIGPTPICAAEDLVCRGCLDDAECPSVAAGPLDDDRDDDGPIAPASESPYCIDRQCRECDPDGHLGCAEAGPRPICRAGDCRVCERDADCDGRPGDLNQCIPGGAAGGQCKLCDPADNAGCVDPQNPVCDPATFSCVPCAGDAECNRGRAPGQAPLECVAGLCSQCDPRDGELNQGCDPLSDVPFCDADRNFCRRCASSAECVALDTERGLDAELFGCVDGDCTECDPITQVGCPDSQVCDPGGSCRPCTDDPDDPLNLVGDEECALGAGDRDQCVAGRCEVCDPTNFAGCDARSGAPVCDADTKTCRGCGPDVECRAAPDRPASPVGPECVAGFCRVCDPSDGAQNAGCDPVSAAPYCDPELFRCAPCGTGVQGDDARCADNPRPGLDQCIGERCAECDPNNHDGCAEGDALPFCDAGRASCRVCNNDAECFIRPGNRDQCVGGQCVVCDPDDDAGCNNPNRPVCDDNDRTCRPCDDDAECPGALLCVTGRCVQCDPGDNRGCDVASGAPFCDPGNSTCRACTLVDGDAVGGARDTECVGADLPQCVGGSCNECDPDTHDGCDESGPTPFCGANGQCRACGNNAECVLRPGTLDYCSAGECVQCNRDSEAGCPGDRPVCDDDTQSCRRCRNSTECIGDQECVDGTCVGCAPGTNEGCDLGSTAPFCDGGTLACRACRADGECAGNPNGGQCYSDRCVECDPGADPQVGCDVAGVEPFCATSGTCRECRGDAECVIAPGNRDQCVGVRCEVCDPADDAGCDPTGAAPVCAGAQGSRRCRGCNDDGECAGKPAGEQCVGGACVECDPVDDSGCDADGAAPVCDGGTRTCGPCRNDGDCAGNPNGAQCVSGACEQCDPADSAGCGERTAAPICDPATKVCIGCANSAQCTLRPGDLNVCVNPECKLCDPDTNLGCGADTPICDNGDRCVPCARNSDCGPGVQCLQDGSCAGCNPDNNAGCLADNPICDADTELCRPCRDDGECGGGFCFAGRCEVCDPEGHGGCGANQLCCQVGAIFNCTQTDPDSQCAACGVACDVDGDPATDGSNACVDRTCRCGALVECEGDQPYCLGGAPDGVCSECRDDDDCTALSDAPICGADVQGNDTNTCRGCANDDECVGHERGAQCTVTGACHVCDPRDDAGCAPRSNQPVCDADFTCRGCRNDGECADNPNGDQCVNSRCVQCDVADDAGCDPASATPVCIAGNVCGCAADGDCAGNPNGTQCVGGICAECDPAAVNAGEAGGGCNLASLTPYCDPGTLECVGCANDDNRCAQNPNGSVCDNNRCVECLLGSHDGCNADELCCGDRFQPACQAVDTDACTACADGACDPDTADTCGDRACQCGAGPACAGGLVCDDGACVDCRVDALDGGDGDCNPGEVCAGGNCQLCDPDTARGCDLTRADGCSGDACLCGAAPQCNLGEFCVDGSCVECAADADCAGDPNGQQCVAGSCVQCEQGTNTGCTAALPICGANNTCGACGGRDGNGDLIDGNAQCAADADYGDFCVAGRCQVCEPNNHGGCQADELCCPAGGAASCVPTTDELCTDCIAALGRCNGQQVCQNRECVNP